MNRSSWEKQDYEQALQVLQDAETDDRPPHGVLDCGRGVRAILPLGLPALGIRLHGAMMLSPLPVFMLCLIAVPIIGFTGSWEVTLLTLTVTAACAAMFLGLYRVLRLLLRQRELFPQQYFCTFGPEGIALHYSRLQLPTSPAKECLSRQEIQSIETDSVCFPLALFTGRWRVPAIRITAASGKSLKVPVAPGSEDAVRGILQQWYQD